MVPAGYSRLSECPDEFQGAAPIGTVSEQGKFYAAATFRDFDVVGGTHGRCSLENAGILIISKAERTRLRICCSLSGQTAMEQTMLSKTSMAILAAVAIFGAAPAAMADGGSKNDADSPSASGGGTRIGPLGQPLGGPSTWRGRPPSIYAYVPRARLDRRWYYEDSYGRRMRY
jgi:hypothetical protein